MSSRSRSVEMLKWFISSQIFSPGCLVGGGGGGGGVGGSR